MSNEIDIDLGTFNLDTTNDIAIKDINVKVAKAISQADLAKIHGSVIPIGKRKNITVQIKGSIVGSDYDDLRSNLDALKAALEASAEQKLTLDDDRFLMVQYSGFSYSYATLRTFAEFSFDVIASDPFWLSETLSEDERTPTSGVGYTIANNGNAATRVKVTLTKTGSGAVVNDIQLENTTTGEKFQYLGTLNSTKALVVNNRVDDMDVTVENDGTDDIAHFEGDLITLNPGNNTIKFTGTAGVKVKLNYREAYL